jgi:hypothetical protein
MKWRDCKKDPSPEGLKVLCCHHGDFYVAIRLKDRYLPFPFNSHKWAPRLSLPEKWQQISFPDDYTGMFFVIEDGKKLTIEGFKKNNPRAYEDFCQKLINSLGKEP